MDIKETEYKLQWAKDNPSICFHPHKSIYIRQPANPRNTDILISCCCNLQTEKLKSMPVADPFKEVKDASLLAELPDACSKCKLEETNGGQSERIRDILGQSISTLDNFTNSYRSNEFEVRVKFSSLCSLACRSCSSTESTTYAKVTKDTRFNKLENDVSNYSEYWDYITTTILENINNTDVFYLHFLGGEAILQPGLIKLCNWLAEKELINKIKLRLTTSMAVPFNSELLKLFSQFQEIMIVMSIDSVGENYKYVRWPVEFSKIESNLADFVSYKESLPDPYKFKFIISPVFSLNNIFYINDYLTHWDFWLNEHKYVTYFVNTNLVAETNYLDIQALPIAYRKNLNDILTKSLSHSIFKNKFAEASHIYAFINSTIQELATWPDNNKLWNNFLYYTAEFDSRTNTKFSELNSKLYNIMSDEDVKNFTDKLLNVKTDMPIRALFS
jgi:hypothetical protein